MKYNFFILLYIFLLFSCGHQFVPIKNYQFDMTLHQLVGNIDKFLLKNPEYNSTLEESSFIKISIPENGDQFSFRLTSDSRLSLYSASKQNRPLKRGNNLNYFSKLCFIKSFEKHFISKLENANSLKDSLDLDPFAIIAGLKKQINYLPHIYIKRDTLITIEVPKELVPAQGFLDVESFLNNFQSYLKSPTRVTQYRNLFSINNCCVGKLEFNKIYVTAFYRQIGQKHKCIFIENGLKWDELVKNKPNTGFKLIENVEQILYKQNWMENQ